MQMSDELITRPRTLLFAGLILLAGCGQEQDSSNPAADSAGSGETDMVAAAKLSDEQVENIVRRSYQYVAMYNVIQKFALESSGALGMSGFNIPAANTALADHTMRTIARPNNDTLYQGAILDLRLDPVII